MACRTAYQTGLEENRKAIKDRKPPISPLLAERRMRKPVGNLPNLTFLGSVPFR